jgi:TRAP-type uncharacterized transport system substrate-binding protein
MEYLKITKIPLAHLLKNGSKRVDWEFFGFDVETINRLSCQGNIDADTMVTCVPITNMELLNSKMTLLQSRVDATPIESDSIEIITEAEKDVVKAQIEAYRATLVQ